MLLNLFILCNKRVYIGETCFIDGYLRVVIILCVFQGFRQAAEWDWRESGDFFVFDIVLCVFNNNFVCLRLEIDPGDVILRAGHHNRHSHCGQGNYYYYCKKTLQKIRYFSHQGKRWGCWLARVCYLWSETAVLTREFIAKQLMGYNIRCSISVEDNNTGRFSHTREMCACVSMPVRARSPIAVSWCQT